MPMKTGLNNQELLCGCTPIYSSEKVWNKDFNHPPTGSSITLTEYSKNISILSLYWSGYLMRIIKSDEKGYEKSITLYRRMD